MVISLFGEGVPLPRNLFLLSVPGLVRQVILRRVGTRVGLVGLCGQPSCLRDTYSELRASKWGRHPPKCICILPTCPTSGWQPVLWLVEKNQLSVRLAFYWSALAWHHEGHATRGTALYQELDGTVTFWDFLKETSRIPSWWQTAQYIATKHNKEFRHGAYSCTANTLLSRYLSLSHRDWQSFAKLNV